MSTPALAKRLVPEFADLSDDDVGDWLTDATLLSNAAAFGVAWPYACAYYAGHLYLQAQGGAGGSSAAPGPVSTVADRAWSIGYGQIGSATMPIADAELNETIPGRRYLEIRRRCGIGSGRALV